MSHKTDGGGDENLSASRMNFGRKFSCNGLQQHDHTHAHEGTTNTPLILKSVDSLLEGFQDSKSSIKPFPAHMKQKVLELLHKLEHDFANIHLLRSLCALLKEVSFSIPKHLRLTLSGLEQTLVAGRSQLLDSVADKKTTFIEPEEDASGNANLIASKKRVLSVFCSCDALWADIADINATIENLMAKKVNLEKVLASREKTLVDLTGSLSTEMMLAEDRLKRFTSFQMAERLEDEARHSFGIAVNCLVKFFESL